MTVPDSQLPWIERAAPAALRPYLRLARWDRPVGTWLLLWPGWWSIALAAGPGTAPDPILLALFAVGALVMRGAGCTYNDIVDRDLDAKVARTRDRPLPAGDVSLSRAAIWLVVQSLIGLAILLSFNRFAVILGAASLLVVAAYPFMKRLTDWPQIVLGLAFNWGALLGWAAVRGSLSPEPVLLYAGAVFWTLGYDTIYAHQDTDDDALIGVRSSALRLGDRTKPALAVFYSIFGAALIGCGVMLGLGPVWYLAVCAAAVHFAWQVRTLDIDDSDNCLRRFRSNTVIGWILIAGAIGGQLFPV